MRPPTAIERRLRRLPLAHQRAVRKLWRSRFSFAELAAICGVSVVTVRRWASALTRPPVYLRPALYIVCDIAPIAWVTNQQRNALRAALRRAARALEVQVRETERRRKRRRR